MNPKEQLSLTRVCVIEKEMHNLNEEKQIIMAKKMCEIQ